MLDLQINNEYLLRHDDFLLDVICPTVPSEHITSHLAFLRNETSKCLNGAFIDEGRIYDVIDGFCNTVQNTFNVHYFSANAELLNYLPVYEGLLRTIHYTIYGTPYGIGISYNIYRTMLVIHDDRLFLNSGNNLWLVIKNDI